MMPSVPIFAEQNEGNIASFKCTVLAHDPLFCTQFLIPFYSSAYVHATFTVTTPCRTIVSAFLEKDQITCTAQMNERPFTQHGRPYPVGLVMVICLLHSNTNVDHLLCRLN